MNMYISFSLQNVKIIWHGVRELTAVKLTIRIADGYTQAIYGTYLCRLMRVNLIIKTRTRNSCCVLSTASLSTEITRMNFVGETAE
jgi:hypothetical protein